MIVNYFNLKQIFIPNLYREQYFVLGIKSSGEGGKLIFQRETFACVTWRR